MSSYSDDKLFYAFEKLPTFYIEIGVVEGKSERKEYVEITNAELMFIQEYGSPIHKIPPRPVLQMTIDWANENLLDDTIDRAMDVFIDSDFDSKALEKELKKMCVRMENYARDLIMSNDGRITPPNAESTIKKKGFDHPLFQTGQLTKAITCNLVKME